jgi:4-oxalomesaconate hydratase
VKAIRRKEAENAAEALNVHDIQFFDLGDYPLIWVRTTRTGWSTDPRRAARFMLSHPIRSLQHRPHVHDRGGAEAAA